jgi:hypothetical protein
MNFIDKIMGKPSQQPQQVKTPGVTLGNSPIPPAAPNAQTPAPPEELCTHCGGTGFEPQKEETPVENQTPTNTDPAAPVKNTSYYNCPDCNGEGLDESGQICPNCKGTGHI